MVSTNIEAKVAGLQLGSDEVMGEFVCFAYCTVKHTATDEDLIHCNAPTAWGLRQLLTTDLS